VFQNRGPATAKLLSPSQVFVRGTITDRSLRRSIWTGHALSRW